MKVCYESLKKPDRKHTKFYYFDRTGILFRRNMRLNFSFSMDIYIYIYKEDLPLGCALKIVFKLNDLWQNNFNPSALK